MKLLYKMVPVLLAGIVCLSGCSSKPKTMGKTTSKDPLGRLMKNKQKLSRDGILAEVATAESGDLQTAIDKTELETRAKLSRSLEAKTSSLQKQFKEETGNEHAGHFSQVTKSISSRVLRGTTLAETRYFKTEDKTYRVYGLMVMDTRLFADALAAEMRAHKAMKDRWLASKAYKELDGEAAEFEKWKREQATPAVQ